MTKPRENELTAVVNREKFDQLPGDISNYVDKERWIQFRKRYHGAQHLEYISPFPLQLDFELNYSCNFRCHFCPHGNPESPQPKKGTKLSFDDFRKAIDEGQMYGLCSIKMNYINEPLLIKDLPRYIQYAKNHGVLNVYFATNGSLLTESVARELIEARTSKIMVSLDAVNSETFKAIRHSDKFESIRENVFRLIKIRNSLGLTYPLVRVNFVKTNLNRNQVDEFIKTWSSIADMVGVEEQVGLPGIENSDMLNTKPEDFKCSFPFKLMVIDSEKNILPCCTFSGREMPMGNLDTSTIEMAWNSFKMVALRQIQLEGRIKDEPICAHCIGLK